MKKTMRATLGILVLSLTLFAGSMLAFAAGSTKIDLSKKNISVGDTFKMTVTGSASDTITVKYNASVLTLTDCSAAGFTSEGNAVTFTGTEGVLTFNAAAEGKSNLIVSANTLEGSSTVINVAAAGGSTTTTTDTNTTKTRETTEDTSEDTSTATSSTEGDFSIGGVEYVVSERFSDDEIYSGFTETKMDIHGHSYKVLTYGAITLVYLKPADNTDGAGEFYVYNTDTDSVSVLNMISAANGYAILYEPDTLPNAALTEVETEISSRTLTVYQIADDTDFYYFYGVNDQGFGGWMTYDITYDMIQRADTVLLAAYGTSSSDGTVAAAESSDSGSKITFNAEELKNNRILLAALVFAAVIILVIIINLVLKRKEEALEGDVWGDSEEEEEEETETEEEETSKERKSKKKKSRRQRNSFWDDEDEDEDEDEEEEEKPQKSETKAAKPQKEEPAADSDEDLIIPDISDFLEKEAMASDQPAASTKKKNTEDDTTSAKREIKGVDLIDFNDL